MGWAKINWFVPGEFMSLGSGQGKTQPVQFLHSFVFWVRGLNASFPLALTSEGPSGLKDLTSGPSLSPALDLTATGVSSLEPSWCPRVSGPFLPLLPGHAGVLSLFLSSPGQWVWTSSLISCAPHSGKLPFAFGLRPQVSKVNICGFW